MTTSQTQTQIDERTFTITFERDFVSPREDVYDAWIDPEQMTLWWDPTGAPLASCTIDARPGGAFSFNPSSDHGPPFQGVYQLLERPAKIVFDALGAVGTVDLETRDAGTHMTVRIRCGSAEHLAQFIKLGVADGTARTLDNLVAHVGRKPTP